jgi:hypothetical protein
MPRSSWGWRRPARVSRRGRNRRGQGSGGAPLAEEAKRQIEPCYIIREPIAEESIEPGSRKGSTPGLVDLRRRQSRVGVD